MEFYLSQSRIFLFTILILPSLTKFNDLEAKSYWQIKGKGEENISILQNIPNILSLDFNQKELIQKINEDWSSTLLAYKNSQGKERNKQKKKMIYILKQVNSLLESYCYDLKAHSANLQLAFTRKLQKQKISSLNQENFILLTKTSQTEYNRGNIAQRQDQFGYAAHLYLRSIKLIDSAFKVMNWSKPENHK